MELATYAKELNIQLHLDIFGIRSLQLAEKIGVPAIKLYGTDIANVGLLNEIAKSKIQRIMLGACVAYYSKLLQALEIFANKCVVVLFGFQCYKTKKRPTKLRILYSVLSTSKNELIEILVE